MKAGNLRHQITFLAVNKTKNSLNEVEETTTEIKSVRADILKNQINEDYVADGFNYGNYKVFNLRFASWIQADQLISYQGKHYQIKAIENPGDRNKELIITAEAI